MQRPSGSRARILAALKSAALLATAAAAQPAPPTRASIEPDRIIMLCRTADGALGPWRDTIVRATVEAFALERLSRTQVRGDVDCPPNDAEIFCRAGVLDRFGPAAICDPRALVRLARATAWYAAQWRRGETYDDFRKARGEKVSMQAIAFAKGRGDSPEAAELVPFMSAAEPSIPRDRDRRAMFDAVLDLTLAAVFGHEAAHMETRAPFCPVSEPGRTEATLLPIVRRVQLSSELFAQRDMVQGESTADRCATRRIRLVRSFVERKPAIDAGMIDFATRAASDLVATGIAFGFGSEEAGVHFHDVPGYYYPALRIALLAGELRAGMPGPPLCGGAAEVAVQAYQLGLRETEGEGQMPDELEEMFPQPVIDAWNGAAWTPGAFGCSQPQARARK